MKCLAVIPIIFLVGCTSMPVIGPCSYLAARSNEPKPGLAAGNESFLDKAWSAAKATAGYAGDTFLIGMAAQQVSKMNESKDDKPSSPTGNDNVIIYNNGGTLNYNNATQSFNGE